MARRNDAEDNRVRVELRVTLDLYDMLSRTALGLGLAVNALARRYIKEGLAKEAAPVEVDPLPLKVAPHQPGETPIAAFKYGLDAKRFAEEKSRTNSVRWVVTSNGKPYCTFFRGEPTDA